MNENKGKIKIYVCIGIKPNIRVSFGGDLGWERGLRFTVQSFVLLEYFSGARTIIFKSSKSYEIAYMREDFWNLVVPRYGFP